MVVFERQQIVAFAIDDLLGDFFLATHRVDRDRRPLQVQQLQGKGIAVISLLLASVATWPSVSRAAQAQAETRCSGFLPAALSNEPRKVLPSMAMCFPISRPTSSNRC